MTDSLTKVMGAEVLDNFMSNGVFDMTPTPERLAIKAKNRL